MQTYQRYVSAEDVVEAFVMIDNKRRTVAKAKVQRKLDTRHRCGGTGLVLQEGAIPWASCAKCGADIRQRGRRA